MRFFLQSMCEIMRSSARLPLEEKSNSRHSPHDGHDVKMGRILLSVIKTFML